MDATQIKEAARKALERHGGWREQAKDDFRMYNGHQWGEDEERLLRDSNRPCLTINELKPMVDVAVGWFIQNQYGLKALAKESGDETKSKTFTYLLRDVLTRSSSAWVFSRCDTDTCICGRSYRMPSISYDYDAYGTVGVDYVPPLSVLYDPMSIKPDLSDAQYVLRVDTMPFEHMLHIYGEAARECKDMNAEERVITDLVVKDLDEIKRHNHYMIIECWYKEYPKRWCLVNPQTGMKYPMESEDAARAAQQQGLIDGFAMPIIHTSIPQVKMRTICGHVELASGDSPFSETDYPIVPQFASIAGNEHMGLVTQGKDAQREYNKRRSLQLHIALVTGVRGWLAEQGVIKNKSEWLDFGTTPGVVLEYAQGRQPPIPIQPPVPPQEQIIAAQMAREDMRGTTSINADLLGTGGDPETSGRAIYLRQQQSYQGLAHLVQAKKQSLAHLGNVLVRTMQRHYPQGKVIRILGEDGKYSTIEFVTDPSLTMYDIVVGEAPEGPTQRVLNYMAMSEFIESIGKFANTPMGPALLRLMLKTNPYLESNKDEIEAILTEGMQMLQQGAPGAPPPGTPQGAAAPSGVTG